MSDKEKIKLIKDILERKSFTEFIDLEECINFEVKGKDGYDFSDCDSKSRFELAKDVSSMANADGGFLIIGLKTKKLLTQKLEKVDSIDYLSKDEVNISQFEGIINEYVFPKISNLSINFITDDSSSESGILVIFIPKQNKDDKYFLIKKILDDNVQLKQIAFGICIRKEDNNNPLNVTEFHQKIKTGYSSQSERLTKIETKIEAILDKLSQSSFDKSDDLFMKRIKDILPKE